MEGSNLRSLKKGRELNAKAKSIRGKKCIVLYGRLTQV